MYLLQWAVPTKIWVESCKQMHNYVLRLEIFYRFCKNSVSMGYELKPKTKHCALLWDINNNTTQRNVYCAVEYVHRCGECTNLSSVLNRSTERVATKVTSMWKIISLCVKRFLIGSAKTEVCVTHAIETCFCVWRPYKTEILNLISLCVIFSVAEPSPPLTSFYKSFHFWQLYKKTVLARKIPFWFSLFPPTYSN